jgi:hypothetical protein
VFKNTGIGYIKFGIAKDSFIKHHKKDGMVFCTVTYTSRVILSLRILPITPIAKTGVTGGGIDDHGGIDILLGIAHKGYVVGSYCGIGGAFATPVALSFYSHHLIPTRIAYLCYCFSTNLFF